MYTKTDTVIRHIKHIADKSGIDAVAFGSDFDGIPGELEFVGCEGMPLLINAHCQVFHESEVEKISKNNALRLFSGNFG